MMSLNVIEWANEVPEAFWLDDGPFDVEWSIICLCDADTMLSKIQGIYIVLSGGNILYIGKSCNLNERFRTGHHKTIKFTQYSLPTLIYIELPNLSRSELANLEKYYIKKHNPILQG